VEKLKGKLSGALVVFQQTAQSESEAYNAYLRGRHYLWRIDITSVSRARECFEKAIALDPSYALAYTGIATGLFMLPVIATADTIKSLTEAKRLLEKAVGLDATLAETACYWERCGYALITTGRARNGSFSKPWRRKRFQPTAWTHTAGGCCVRRAVSKKLCRSMSALISWNH
jgi:tetratricopeptide (TPR) repeat protein